LIIVYPADAYRTQTLPIPLLLTETTLLLLLLRWMQDLLGCLLLVGNLHMALATQQLISLYVNSY
jgi:hypothetical protein